MQTPTAERRLLRRTWRVTGQVQGVGFRPFVYRVATELGLSGTVRNDPRGVTIEAWGAAGDLDELGRRVAEEAPALARVESVRVLAEAEGGGESEGFNIIESDREPAERGRVTVDSAVCEDCLREMFDPADRRYGHGLINCTNCGPRYTIVRDLPYDRPLTTMAGFGMCAECTREYGDPADRRFHAQPTCCPACGPRVRLLGADGRGIEGDPIERAAALLRGGRIIAMKGLGGYHLVVDACNEAAVGALRRGKRRDHKPFAVMFGNVESAERRVVLSDRGRTLLGSPISPIVLAARKEPPAFGVSSQAATEIADIAGSVAMACHRLGVMVPNTPLQHLLLAQGLEALVMTSANESDDPLIKDDGEARRRLGGFCEAFLTHDRPIERAVDDSIVLDGALGIVPIRRARGYVPAPLSLPVEARRPGLCVGGELKNAVAVVRGGNAVLSQHIGDLTYALAYRRFEQTIADLRRLFDVDVGWVACDAHPRYISQRFAKRLAAKAGLDLLVVQHHHAHLASVLAEHDRTDRVIGIVCDGVGYGDDGTAWGGEILLGDLTGYERVGRLRPLRLPGGDAAAKQVGRCASSWMWDTLGEGAAGHPVMKRVLAEERERAVVLGLLREDVNCPPSSGMGRLFDASAALLGICDYNAYEAMSGLLLEAAAWRAKTRPAGDGAVDVTAAGGADDLLELDQRALLRRILTMLEAGEAVASIAWFFHDALADGMARSAMQIATATGIGTVALSGGVFCNMQLCERTVDRLSAAGLEVLLHRDVPPGDGGLAYGQAAIAAATLATRDQ